MVDKYNEQEHKKKKLDNFSLIFFLIFFLIEYYQFINENESVYYLFEVRT